MYLILALIAGGMFVGWLAQVILGRGTDNINWPLALGAGFAGSFVGGLVSSLLSGDGLSLRPSGIIGSVIGALVVTIGWQAYQRSKA